MKKCLGKSLNNMTPREAINAGIDIGKLPTPPLPFPVKLMNDLPKHNPYLPIDKQDADEIPDEQDSQADSNEEPEKLADGFIEQQMGLDDQIIPGELDKLTGLL